MTSQLTLDFRICSLNFLKPTGYKNAINSFFVIYYNKMFSKKDSGFASPVRLFFGDAIRIGKASRLETKVETFEVVVSSRLADW